MAAAAPYRPADDAEVLERLPAGAVSGRLQVAAPADAATAAVLARGWLARARQGGDPRFLGYAEGVLQPWWGDASAPSEILLLRATLLQSRHRFAEALDGLDVLLAREPGHPQGLLTRAMLLRVQGRYAEAQEACAALGQAAPGVPAQICGIALQGLQGGLPAAAQALDRLEPRLRAEPAAVRLWYYAEAAEMAARLGDGARALAIYDLAIAQTGGDSGLRAAAADQLLDLGRAGEVERYAGGDDAGDALLLRLAIAARAQGRARPELEQRLAEAHAAARQRGDSPHLREEARLALDVLGEPARALELAQLNWAGQREPADALLLARAIAAAGHRSAAAPLRQWLRETGLQDQRVEQALAAVSR